MKKDVQVRKRSLHDPPENDLKGKTPAELMGMMWPLTLKAWGFKEGQPEPRMQKDVVVLKKLHEK